VCPGGALSLPRAGHLLPAPLPRRRNPPRVPESARALPREVPLPAPRLLPDDHPRASPHPARRRPPLANHGPPAFDLRRVVQQPLRSRRPFVSGPVQGLSRPGPPVPPLSPALCPPKAAVGPVGVARRRLRVV